MLQFFINVFSFLSQCGMLFAIIIYYIIIYIFIICIFYIIMSISKYIQKWYYNNHIFPGNSHDIIPIST